MQDSDLDEFLAAARRGAPEPSASLLMRIEADGRRLQPAQPAATPRHRGRPGLFGILLQAVGGLGGAAGLASAALAGVWIGIAQPQGLSSFTEGLAAGLSGGAVADSVELIPALDPFAGEG